MKRKRRKSGGVGGQTIRWDRQALGKVPDVEIADALGCHRSSVQEARAKRGIPAYVDPKRSKRRTTAARLRLAGRSLSQIAKVLGVSRQRAHQLVEGMPVSTKSKFLSDARRRAGNRRKKGARKRSRAKR